MSINPSEQHASSRTKDKVISCAECRRLKVKCDRVFPCSSCRKRGLAALCPNAALNTRQRKSHTSTLASLNPQSNTEYRDRIEELEEALRILQAQVSSEPHPLLDEELRIGESEDVDELNEALGTLTIDPESGKSSFFGQSGGMESLYHNELVEETDQVRSFWSLDPFDPLRDTTLNPLLPSMPNESLFEYLESQLPEPLRAWTLCETYYSNAAWLYTCIPRETFQNTILVPVYSTTPPSLRNARLTHTDMAILFMIFAMGTMVELPSQSETSDSAEATDNEKRSARYHHLARGALTAGPSTLEEPTISGIRCLFLMSYYQTLLDRPNTPNIVWSLLSAALAQASNIGLHRDPGGWNMDPPLIEERRNLFWELNLAASFQGMELWPYKPMLSRPKIYYLALGLGRPPAMTVQFSDCEVGADPEQKKESRGRIKHGYEYRRNLFTATILGEVRDLVLSVKQRYSDVLNLDRRIRDVAEELFGGEVGGLSVGPEILKGPDRPATMRKFYMMAAKEILIMYLHRRYFVRVCSGPSEDLATSKYSPSFFASFRSAQTIIRLMRSLLILEPQLPSRFGFFWNHTLASAIFVGSVVIHHPQSILAEEAMEYLENVLGQLRQWATQTGGSRAYRPMRALQIVMKLREKAHLSLTQPEAVQEALKHTDPALIALGGYSRIVESKSRRRNSPGTSTSSGSVNVADIHPALVEELRSARERTIPPPTTGRQSYQMSPVTEPLPASSIYPQQIYTGSGQGVYPQPQGHAANAAYNQLYQLYPQQYGIPYPTQGSPTEVDASRIGPEREANYVPGPADETNWEGFIAGLGV
ncbi:hypothetical protein M422DRAFT_273719 [Sphaerobolus stellatus SS14]|uniref:Zn(2)-C6 fungal-type domain-containing protein n=1 Tax=Sphaerobolus stellatus (strain SS14) TaxID=990650 RepID=A0A0C9TTZ7_SPHS4|nr:hypothetical protein M422DRAFT_273719 [Sphaerobolus stellatus SS14]